ncbi:MAG: AI-2E family transporter [Rikenellaceae bacterium]|nr:AI-2E family transporter [Rikenellaceae bacterium]
MAIIFKSGKYNDFFRQLMFLAVLITIGILIFLRLQFFVGAALGAFTLYMVFRTWMFRLTEKLRWKPWIAGVAVTGFCFVLLSGIGYAAYTIIAREMPSVDASKLVDGAKSLVAKANNMFGMKLVTPDTALEKSGSVAGKVVGAVFNTTYSFVANIFMMLIIVYFMFTKGRKMECYVYRYSPFHGESLATIKREVKNIVFSNAVGIPLIMVAQTIVSSILYWAVGMENYLFWGFLTALCGLIPLIGSGIVYMLVAIYYLIAGSYWIAAIVFLYGVLIISNTDNVIRIVLMHKVNNTHPLIVIFGVIIGIPMFGFWGIIFGPLFLSIFFLLIRIYYAEYRLLLPQDEAESYAGLGFSENRAPFIPAADSVSEVGSGTLQTAHIDRQAIAEAVEEQKSTLLNGDPCDCVKPPSDKKPRHEGKFMDRFRKDNKENL